MYEYSINVALSGKHLFRTAWYDKPSIEGIAVIIKSSMPLAEVTVTRRSSIRQKVVVGPNLQVTFPD